MIDSLNRARDRQGLATQGDVFGGSDGPSSSPPPWLPRLFVPVLAALLFAGAVLWARGRDPFRRIWFDIKSASFGKAPCVAVLPRTPARLGKIERLPVVVYLHGSGDSLLADGNDLRQMAEMGLAAVSMEYSKTNQEANEPQLTALLAHLGRQGWADTSRVAWVGLSLGAQRMLSFALSHPALQPRLLVRLAGGGVEEMRSAQFGTRSMGSEEARRRSENMNSDMWSTTDTNYPPAARQMSVLLIHGEQDEVFPLDNVRRVDAWFRSHGVPVELKVLAGQTHAFGENRRMVFRAVGEQCLTRLEGQGALKNYRSILAWQSQAVPLWVYWLPAVAWVGLWAVCRWRANSAAKPQKLEPLTRGMKALRFVTCVLAVLALAQTTVHLIGPTLNVSKRALDIARRHLVAPKETEDFAYLSSKPIWQGKKLGTLLEHVELAHYNTYELVNWKLESSLFRDFVLCPEVDPEFDGNLKWRRALWENFYPRIRREQSPSDAAVIVARFLRERVTLAKGHEFDATIEQMWTRQIAGERGFEALYVAAMRSVGIPARLPHGGKAELWDKSDWHPAPRPLIEGAIGLEPSGSRPLERSGITSR